VAGGEILLEGELIAESAFTRYSANPIFPIKSLRLKVRREKPVIDMQYKIELTVFYQFGNAVLPRKKFKLRLKTAIDILTTQSWEHNRAHVIGTGHPEVALLSHRVEETRLNEVLHFGEQSLQLIEDLPASQCEFEALWRTNQKVVSKHRARSLERSANGRLTQQQPVRSSRDTLLLCNCCKSDQEV
jgi:hypothetical protein